MNNLMVFENKQVEVFELEGRVLFNPRNVGECLDLTPEAVRKAIMGMNEKQVLKLNNSNVTSSNFRKLHNTGENFLTESGVYKLIFKSRKAEAERFQDWVTDQVLPQIRQTGGYIQIHEDDDAETLMAKALMVAQKTLDKKEQLLKERDRVIAAQDKVIESKEIELTDKNRFINQISASTDCILVGDLAHIITKQGFKIGQNRLFVQLREWKLLQQNNKPYQRALEQGLFEVSEFVVQTHHGVKLRHTTRVTGKGQVYIIERLLKENKEIA